MDVVRSIDRVPVRVLEAAWWWLSHICIAVVSAIGWSGMFGIIGPVDAAIVLLVSIGTAPTRFEVQTRSMAYFGAALWPMIPAYRSFFPQEPTALIVLIYLLVSASSASLFALCWSSNPVRRGILVALAVAIYSALPIGIASPLTAAGALFPGTGFLGIILMLLCCFSLVVWCKPLLIGLATACIVTNAFYREPAQHNWYIAETHWDGVSDYARLAQIVTPEAAKYAVYPESAQHDWSTFSDDWEEDAFNELARQGKTVLFGAQRVTGRDSVENVLLARGASTAEYRQRVPIPMAMWGNGFHANLNPEAPGTIDVGDRRVAVLLCYEQLLVAPVLASMVQDADMILALSNLKWIQGTTIGKSQQMCVDAWGRLFGVPVVRSVND